MTQTVEVKLCVSSVISLECPTRNSSSLLEKGLDLMNRYNISRYDLLGPLIALGAEPNEARKALGVRISGNIKRPIQTFYERYRGRLGEDTVVKILYELYRAAGGECLCPVGPIVPFGPDRYLVQRPSGIYLCESGNCREIAPEPIALYDHPQGCQLYNPALQIVGQPVAVVAGQLKALKIAEPDLVAQYLLPALCRDLRGVELKTFEFF
ncbi:hypothetical protein [Thermoproteus tenax]|uniref:Uncharacterized protein n=1 Tax=Thermoproteus tenax (strain ATCC 35583 / DSM 2078 / JCM 9277 / NBRC 100435 / Kra 1) TaxID=768679 RepID=G4RPU8_THETK|nr:hypothetical protein [Thermoproteus tenax]CCC81593.1 conserved hypothetical protein [Thermoproteus tenax Kra 1]